MNCFHLQYKTSVSAVVDKFVNDTDKPISKIPELLKSYLEIFTFLTFRETNFKDKKDINIDLKDENESNDPKYDIEHDPLTADIKKIQEKVPWMQFIDRETIVLCDIIPQLCILALLQSQKISSLLQDLISAWKCTNPNQASDLNSLIESILLLTYGLNGVQFDFSLQIGLSNQHAEDHTEDANSENVVINDTSHVDDELNKVFYMDFSAFISGASEKQPQSIQTAEDPKEDPIETKQSIANEQSKQDIGESYSFTPRADAGKSRWSQKFRRSFSFAESLQHNFFKNRGNLYPDSPSPFSQDRAHVDKINEWNANHVQVTPSSASRNETFDISSASVVGYRICSDNSPLTRDINDQWNTIMASDTSFALYEICVQTKDGQIWKIERRFRDFFQLDEELHDIVATLPVRCALHAKLPNKTAFRSLSTKFLDARKHALDRYLHMVLDHPVLCRVATLYNFLSPENSHLRPILPPTLADSTFPYRPSKNKMESRQTSLLQLMEDQAGSTSDSALDPHPICRSSSTRHEKCESKKEVQPIITPGYKKCASETEIEWGKFDSKGFADSHMKRTSDIKNKKLQSKLSHRTPALAKTNIRQESRKFLLNRNKSSVLDDGTKEINSEIVDVNGTQQNLQTHFQALQCSMVLFSLVSSILMPPDYSSRRGFFLSLWKIVAFCTKSFFAKILWDLSVLLLSPSTISVVIDWITDKIWPEGQLVSSEDRTKEGMQKSLDASLRCIHILYEEAHLKTKETRKSHWSVKFGVWFVELLSGSGILDKDGPILELLDFCQCSFILRSAILEALDDIFDELDLYPNPNQTETQSRKEIYTS